MRRIKNRIDAFIRTEKWNIGVVRQSAESLVVNRRLIGPVQWLNEDVWDASADPFVLQSGDDVLIFYEEVKRFRDNGEIYVIKNMDFGTKQKVDGLEPGTIHYSYPYIIKDGDDVYCIPESSAAGEVTLYKFTDGARTKLGKVKTLLGGGKYVDTSIVRYKNLYWLFTTCKDDPSKLYIYFADRIDGRYQAHAMNPIAVDPYTSRGAGNIFMVNNMLYRPSQNETEAYGGSVLVSRINELTETTYRSEFLFEIKPEQPNTEGLHHVSVEKDIIVIDGKSKRFVPENMWRKIVHKFSYNS